MAQRLLAIDVGNTHIVVGSYERDRLCHSWRFCTKSGMTEDELAATLSSLMCSSDPYRGMKWEGQEDWMQHGVVIACAVPALRRTLHSFCNKYLMRPPVWVGSSLRTGLTFVCEHPQRMGADRIANAVAAHVLYGSPVIVVDLGTATTFTVVAQGGRVLGGSIAPGVQMMGEILFQRVDHLPSVEVALPEQAIGRDTHPAIQSGIYYGILGSLEGIIHSLQRDLQKEWGESRAKVVATGGGSHVWVQRSNQIDLVDTQLTLQGLKILYEQNVS